MKCKECGSKAINPGINGRNVYQFPHLCDACYWKTLYEVEHSKVERYEEAIWNFQTETKKFLGY
ncbi:MAG: hypothetical protein DRQ41_14290 [Gammaproteobacteria bacterium]|nr:MAG: hypothetical protein DRQ41_14290 [Gammaproteobacteria bacterium]